MSYGVTVKFAKAFFRNRPVRDIEVRDVQKFIAHLKDGKHRKGEDPKGAAEATQRKTPPGAPGVLLGCHRGRYRHC